MAADDERWIARGEAMARLGVKAQTLYAYVSRGRIAARPDPADPRRSLYAAGDIARLAGGEAGETVQTPASGAASRGVAEVQSSVSLIAGGRLFYRGLDAVQLSDHATLEETARRLWNAGGDNPFADLKPRIDPITGGPTQRRMLAVLGRRALEDPPARRLAPGELARAAASLLNETVDALAGPGPRLYLHQRLARGWKIAERDAPLLRRALVLAADEGLDDAVLAVRAAVSGGASLAGAVTAGLATLAGSRLMDQLDETTAFLVEARRDPQAAAGRWQAARTRTATPFPGGDPRAKALMDAAELTPELEAARAAGEAACGPDAAFVLALALVARRLDMGPTGAGDLMMTGRLTGLLSQAVDQVADGSPIRVRLRYVGPEPGAN